MKTGKTTGVSLLVLLIGVVAVISMMFVLHGIGDGPASPVPGHSPTAVNKWECTGKCQVMV